MQFRVQFCLVNLNQHCFDNLRNPLNIVQFFSQFTNLTWLQHRIHALSKPKHVNIKRAAVEFEAEFDHFAIQRVQNVYLDAVADLGRPLLLGIRPFVLF